MCLSFWNISISCRISKSVPMPNALTGEIILKNLFAPKSSTSLPINKKHIYRCFENRIQTKTYFSPRQVSVVIFKKDSSLSKRVLFYSKRNRTTILNIFITAKSTSQMQLFCNPSINKLGQITATPVMLRMTNNRKQTFHIVHIT